MSEDWTDDQLIDRVMCDHRVPRGEAICALQEAWGTGKIAPPYWEVSVRGEDGRYRLTPQSWSPITGQLVHDQRWATDIVEHMLWLVRQQLGVEPKDDERKRRGSRTASEARAEEEALVWFRKLPSSPRLTHAKAFKRAQVKYLLLTETAFKRIWKVEAKNKEWDKKGRF